MRNQEAPPILPFEKAQKILQVIRTGCDHIILTGGEPLLVPYIDQLIAFARKELRFRHITLLTNASLLSDHQDVLLHIDRLGISLDTPDTLLWSGITRSTININETILENIGRFAAKQKQYGFRIVINSVLTPQTIDSIDALLAFSVSNNISISFSPQSVNNWPHYDLLISDKYKQAIDHLIDCKSRGFPILASSRYLNSVRNNLPYSCYPMLVPRVWSDGSLIYPCRPIEKEKDMHGGQPCNLLDLETWDQAINIAQKEYGIPPRVCTSCFQQCYAEPSLMQFYPLSMLKEVLFFPTCRRGDISSHAPG